MKSKTFIASLTATTGLLAGSANAAITQVDTFVSTSITDGLNYSGIDASGLNITGASKLVVTVGAEGNSSNGANPGGSISLTYGGAALTLINSGSSNRSSVWYLDLAGATLSGTDIDLVFSGGETMRGYYLSAYTLSGTASGFSSTTQNNTGTAFTISPPTANEFLIAGYSRNSSSGTITGVSAGLTILDTQGLDGQYAGGSVYGQLTAAGDQEITISGMNSSGATIVATFAEVPEPGSLALLGLGGLLIGSRRRRA